MSCTGRDTAVPRFPWRRAALLLLTGGLALLLMAPLGAPLVLDQLGRSGPEAVSVEEPDDGTTDLLAYLMPPDLYPRLWPEIPEPLPYPGWEPYHTISASAYYVPFIGLVTLGLALVGLLRAWSKTWPWLLLALGIMLMAFGPELAINGQRFPGVPMPYRLIEESLARRVDPAAAPAECVPSLSGGDDGDVGGGGTDRPCSVDVGARRPARPWPWS